MIDRPAPRDFAARVKELERQRAQLRGIADILAGKNTPEARAIFLNVNQYMRQSKDDKRNKT